jgi:hypothetical protein
VARVADLPWEGEDPDHWRNAPSDEALDARRRSRAGQRARGDRRVQPVGVDAASQLERAPGSRITTKVRAFVRGGAWMSAFGEYGGATSPRR